MKKFLILIILVIVLIAGYFVYAKFACIKPYQKIFVVYRDSSGVISDAEQCKYAGWYSRYSKPVTQ